MFDVSTRSLKILAGFVWHVGGIVVLLKAAGLLAEANALRPGEIWPLPATALGLVIGGLRAKSIFSKSCRRNMDRIAALSRPKVWQFFRPRFFVLLMMMIGAGATLSRLAHRNYAFLIGAAALDLAIAVALLGSGYVFWRQ